MSFGGVLQSEITSNTETTRCTFKYMKCKYSECSSYASLHTRICGLRFTPVTYFGI